jgi:hypothetical protein
MPQVLEGRETVGKRDRGPRLAALAPFRPGSQEAMSDESETTQRHRERSARRGRAALPPMRHAPGQKLWRPLRGLFDMEVLARLVPSQGICEARVPRTKGRMSYGQEKNGPPVSVEGEGPRRDPPAEGKERRQRRQ